MEILDRRTSVIEREPEEPKVDGYSTWQSDNFEAPIPTFNKILVKLDGLKDDDKKIGSIILADTSIKSVNTGTVIATGKFAVINGITFDMKDHVEVGDRVTVTRVKKDPTEVNGTEYGLFNLVDVKLIYKKKA